MLIGSYFCQKCKAKLLNIIDFHVSNLLPKIYSEKKVKNLYLADDFLRISVGYLQKPEFYICSRDLQGPDISGPAHTETVSAQPGLKLKEKLKFQPKPGPANFFSDFGPDHLRLSDFKAGAFSCLHIINVFFCWWFIFMLFIKQLI